jgi:hypothetical protein
MNKEFVIRKDPQAWFLNSMAHYHQHLAKAYMDKPIEERGKPMICALEGLEIGLNPLYKQIDTSRFLIPTTLLINNNSNNVSPACTHTTSILPLLRCVGLAHALRIVAALLGERRVLMVSQSPTRLARCSHAALAMLAQGLLQWQHLYVPVLPPHLWQYLAAPYPYLMGVLTSMLPKLDRTDGLGEVLMIHLDKNELETRGMNNVAQQLPDLFVASNAALKNHVASSATEFLAADLLEVLKADKRILYGESTLQNVSETTVKAAKLAKKTLFKVANKGMSFLKDQMGTNVRKEELQIDEVEVDLLPEADDTIPESEKEQQSADYIYTESCHNESCEEEARVAFATFFLCMYGDMRWYLTSAPGQTPQLDLNKFLQQKSAMGDGQGTPMWPLLQNFCHTQMLQEFAKARVEEVRIRAPVAPDAPLFSQCAAFHRQNNLGFDIVTVRRVRQQISHAGISRLTGQLQTNARRNAMLLTSNKEFQGDFTATIAQLVEQCRECSLVLFDVMSVIWLRLRDCKGMNWKHSVHALQILRNLLYHGPMAAITEATDGLDKIRSLKFYENMRAAGALQVRIHATAVYDLLVDRSRLFSIRRFCIEKRREMKHPSPKVSCS